MNLVFVHQTRRKAVWGPKRTLLAALVFVLGASPGALAGEPHGKKLRAGKPNHFVHNYKLDDELDARSNDAEKRHDTVNRSQVIVELEPGAQLPRNLANFGRLGQRLDVINGYVLELPNGLLKKLADLPGVARVHYDRPTRSHNYRTAVTVGARNVFYKYGYTGAGIGVAVI